MGSRELATIHRISWKSLRSSWLMGVMRDRRADEKDSRRRMGRDASRRRGGGGERVDGEEEIVLSGGRDEKRRRRWIDSAKW